MGSWDVAPSELSPLLALEGFPIPMRNEDSYCVSIGYRYPRHSLYDFWYSRKIEGKPCPWHWNGIPMALGWLANAIGVASGWPLLSLNIENMVVNSEYVFRIAKFG